jgi:hypothetical protein
MRVAQLLLGFGLDTCSTAGTCRSPAALRVKYLAEPFARGLLANEGKEAATEASEVPEAGFQMARSINDDKYQVVTVENPNWPELLSKTVDDLSRVAKTEIELLEATLKRLIESQTDKIVGMLVLVVALTYGSVFLLGGIVLLIHLWLAWWLSFLITGIAICSAGVVFQMRMTAAAKNI